MKVSGEIFRNKSFLYFWMSSMLTAMGDSIFMITLMWLLVQISGSPVVVGTYILVVTLTKFSFVLFGGVVVDRFSVKKLLIGSAIGRGSILLLLFAVIAAGDPNLFFFYAAGVIFGLIDAVSEPAAITFRTRLVPEKHYTQSMSLLMMAGQAASVVGPLLGAMLYAIYDAKMAFLLNGFAFFAAAGLFLFISVKEERSVEESSSFFAGIKEGFAFFVGSPVLATMAAFAFFANAAVGAVMVSLPFLMKDLNYGIQGYGWAHTSLAIGSVVAAILFSLFVIHRPKPYMTLLTCFLQGASILLIGFFSEDLALLLFFLALVGFLEAAVNVIAPSVNHALIPPKLFGRVIGIMVIIMGISEPIAAGTAGLLIEKIGADGIFVWGGSMEMLVAVIVFSFPFIRHFKSNEERS
ncbi:MFS transporter [Fictibacillus nanhaiensis]|uniref:MFS transporter n=1 Tax=Fictibacillus nanhaiensis TaxID=742169 RepID=UPI001C96A166|nr:MFS transporter [Fictibacillus nanhaiensis]MBY6036446.1 MFS transporter [Fictibacillus nanhaiensis]